MDKESGAFSANVYGRHPFIKMNYQNSLDDLSTLAHEFGHAVHSSLTMEAQPYSSSRYVPFLAEIASTINEKFLSDHLVRNAESDAMKAYVLTELAENIRTTIYRQTLFAEFEKTVHGYIEDGVPVTAALLDETYAGLVGRYYGDGFTVGPNDGMEWAYIPHFYYKYYVYSYATGLSSGIALAGRIEEGGEKAVQDYLGMLQGGCSRPPLDLLKSAGVDLTKPEPIEAALKLFEQTVAELEKLL
jgi:oligoendopeptidase F